MIKSVLEVIYKFFRGTIRLLTTIIVIIFARIIWLFEPKKKKLTIGKFRRVRFFTKLKLMLLRYAPHLVSFFGWKPYLEDLKQRLDNGLQLCDNRTD